MSQHMKLMSFPGCSVDNKLSIIYLPVEYRMHSHNNLKAFEINDTVEIKIPVDTGCIHFITSYKNSQTTKDSSPNMHMQDTGAAEVNFSQFHNFKYACAGRPSWEGELFLESRVEVTSNKAF